MSLLFNQKTAYEMRISDWSSDVCSSDLGDDGSQGPRALPAAAPRADGARSWARHGRTAAADRQGPGGRAAFGGYESGRLKHSLPDLVMAPALARQSA